MIDISSYYDYFKVLHIISMTAWMAGMFYLPRLFVYHADTKIGSEQDFTFRIMEKRLLRIIMNPAMIFTIIFGLIMAYIYGFLAFGVWFHIKMALVIFMIALHGLFSWHRKQFENGKNQKKAIYYRIINEISTILFISIVILVIIKPFE